MVHVVDTVEVEASRVDEYLEAVEALGIAVMTEAGAQFVSCRATSKDLGEPVHIEVTWGVEDHERWNEVRRNLVLDPRWYAYGDRVSGLRSGGTRRFFYPVAIGAPEA